VVEDSRPSASEDVEAAEDAEPSTKSTGEKKEKVRPSIPFYLMSSSKTDM
jgi:hypothetical protein